MEKSRKLDSVSEYTVENFMLFSIKKILSLKGYVKKLYHVVVKLVRSSGYELRFSSSGQSFFTTTQFYYNIRY